MGPIGGKGQAGVCTPDEDTLTLAVDAALRALAAAGIEPDGVDGLWWGTSRPPFAEGPSHAVLAVRARPLPPLRRRALRRLTPLRPGRAHRRQPTRSAPARREWRSWSPPTRWSRVSAPASRPGAVPARRRSSSRPRAARAAITARVTRTHPLLDRYRGDGETTTRDLYDPRLFREEMFLPAVREVGEHLAAFDGLTWSLPDPDGRLGGTVAKQVGATNVASHRGLRRGRRHRRGGGAARRHRRARRGRFGRVRRLRRRSHDRRDRHRRLTGSRRGIRGATVLNEGRPTTYTEVLRARGQLQRRGRADPHGRAARERAVRPRRRGDAAAPRWSLHRLRHDQHAAVDPPRVHRVRRHEARAGAARPARHGAHLRGQPDDAGTVRRAAADRGRRPRGRRADHAAGGRRRRGHRDRHRGRAGAAEVRARARGPGLRVEDPRAAQLEGTTDEEAAR